MIWDVFPFRDELDMLECRLTQFEGRITQHVLVEAPIDHQGHTKPLHYKLNQERFRPWHNRITSLTATTADLPSVAEDPDPWSRERAQRDRAMAYVLPRVLPGDIIFIADVDEIPSQAALAARPRPRHTLVMGILAFAVDWVSPARDTTTVCVEAGTVDMSFSEMRLRKDDWPRFEDGGWHISWLGGKEAIAAKLEAFCHLELRDKIAAMNARDELYGQGLSWFHEGTARLTEYEATWPRYIREGQCPPEWFRNPVRRKR